jgi:hypothetical protein
MTKRARVLALALTSASLAATASQGCGDDLMDRPLLVLPDEHGAIDGAMTDATTGGGTSCAMYQDKLAGVGAAIVAAAQADCRIASHLGGDTSHFAGCLEKELEALLACPGANFVPGTTTDAMGRACEDPKTAHAGLGLNQPDFDAFVEDLLGVLPARGVPAADIAFLTGPLRATAPSIVTGGGTQYPSACSCPGGRAPDGTPCEPPKDGGVPKDSGPGKDSGPKDSGSDATMDAGKDSAPDSAPDAEMDATPPDDAANDADTGSPPADSGAGDAADAADAPDG